MQKFKWDYDDIVFTLTIFANNITQLSIGGYGLITDHTEPFEFIGNIQHDMIGYNKNNKTLESILKIKHFGCLFTTECLYFKKYHDDIINEMIGDEYTDFYNWIYCCLFPKENRMLKINKILKYI